LFQILVLTNLIDANAVQRSMGAPVGMPMPPAGMPQGGMLGLPVPGAPMTEAQKQQMLMTLVNTPQAQIDALPAAQRNQIMALKQQLLGQ